MSLLMNKKKVNISISLNEKLEFIYSPGQSVEGSVQIQIPSIFSNGLSLSDFVIEFVGNESSLINDPYTIAEEKRRQHHTFCSSKEILTPSTIFPAGTHEFPFSCKLPDYDIPSTFSFNNKQEENWSSKCSVKYFIRCQTRILNRDLGNAGIHFLSCNTGTDVSLRAEKEFMVNGTKMDTLNDNKIENQVTSIVTSIDQIHNISCCGLAPKGPTMYSIKVLQKEYSVGDNINVSFQLQKNTVYDSVYMQMREHISWMAEGKAVSQTLVLTTKSLKNVEKGKKHWYKATLKIPPLATKAFDGILINVSHDIRLVLISRSSWNSSPETILPVKITKKIIGIEKDQVQNNVKDTENNLPKKLKSMEFIKNRESSTNKVDNESTFSRQWSEFLQSFTACFFNI